MAPKRRLITDSFKVVKKARTEEKGQAVSPDLQTVDSDPEPLTGREKDLEELRKFDLNWRFGPCTGISRLQRWERASLHGLHPPQEVRELLLKIGTDANYTHSLWKDYPL